MMIGVFRFFGAPVCLGVVAVLSVGSFPMNAKPKKVLSVEGITQYHLDNGLKVLLFPDPSKPTVTVNITYLVGSRHEGLGETGMAHLLEHMLFKGTDKLKNVWGELEDHGARFNGTTWVDRTNYYETLPSTDENLEFAISLEADRMINSRVSGEDLSTEMTVVRNEFEMGENNPGGVLLERMMSAAYLWHNYGKSTIGNRSDIERVPVANLRQFYKKYYQPDNAVLVVAGKFDEEKTLALIEENFGVIPKPTRVLDSTYTVEPPQDGARFVTLRRVGDVGSTGVLYHIPSGAHSDFPALQVFSRMLTDQPSGRLYKALVESGKATGVFGTAFGWAEPGVMQVMAQVRKDQSIDAVREEMVQLMESWSTNKITDQEVNRAKTQILNGIKLALANSGRIAVTLSDWAAKGDWRLFFLHRDRVKEVTTADVQRVAETYFLPSNRTAGTYYPSEGASGVTIPESPDVTTLVAGYEGSEAIAVGEVFEATPEAIEKRTKRLTLENGIKVALLAKETRGNVVHAQLTFHHGTEESANGHQDALGLMAALMMRGTTKMSFQEIEDEMDRLQSRIRVRGGVGGISSSITTDRENLLPAIELVGEVVKNPTFPKDQLKILVTQRLSRLEQSLSNPQSLAMTTLRRAMNPWPKSSIHYVPTIPESIERIQAVTLDEIKDYYSKQCGASYLEASFVGDFDEKEVIAALNRVFGSWKSPSPYARIARPYREITALVEDINTPDKKNAIVVTGTAFAMRDDHPDYPALSFANYILGQSAKSRLLNRLRHKGGLSYGAGSSLRVDDTDRSASMTGFAICAPQNAAEAQVAMKEEIEQWIDQGVLADELKDGKKSFALRMQSQLSNDRFLVGELRLGLETGRKFTYHKKMVEAVESLTLDGIKEALSKHLGNAPFVEIKGGDFGKPDPVQ